MTAPYPYIWADVALVHFLAALPLAVLLAAQIRARCSPFVSLVICAVCLCASSMVLLAINPPDAGAMWTKSLIALSLLRSLTAWAIALPASLAISLLYRQTTARDESRTWRAMALAGSAVTLLLVPSVYVRARSQHDAQALTRLIKQSRMAKARTLAHGMLDLDPAANVKGISLRDMALAIETRVAELEERVATPLSEFDNPEMHIERAHDLAMLGRDVEALAHLDSSTAAGEAPEAIMLRAIILEAKGDHLAARESYAKAKHAWALRPESAERTSGIQQAITGIGNNNRMLGRVSDAEAAYLELIEVAPTADTHFLLAEFYDQAQQTGAARTHARLAMELAPERYGSQGALLIDKLVSKHFGCLGVSSAEWEQPRGSLPGKR